MIHEGNIGLNLIKSHISHPKHMRAKIFSKSIPINPSNIVSANNNTCHAPRPPKQTSPHTTKPTFRGAAPKDGKSSRSLVSSAGDYVVLW